MIFYGCHCGTVACWEDEANPQDSDHWAANVALLKKAGADLIIFNGGKEVPPSFSGIN
jgi:hypothetical protein